MALNHRLNPQTRRRLAAANLKRCPLCGAVNAHQNEDCFACGWHGQFDRDPEVVEEGLNQLIDRCPELANAADFAPKPLSLWDRVRAFFRRRVDYRA